MTKKIDSKIKSIQSNLIQDLSNEETEMISGGNPESSNASAFNSITSSNGG